MKTLKSAIAVVLTFVVTGCASLEPSGSNDIHSMLQESSQHGGF